MIKLAASLVGLAGFYYVAFKVSYVAGAAILVGHAAYELLCVYEDRQLLKQLQQAKYRSTEQVEWYNEKGNC